MSRGAVLVLLVIALAATALPPTVARAQAAGEVPVTAAPDDPIVEQVYDTGELLPPATQTTGVDAQRNCCGIVFSGDAQVRIGLEGQGFPAAGPGASATLPVTVPEAGRYEVSTDLTTAPDYGIVAVSVDGTAVGAPYDAYSTTVGVDRRVRLGEVELAAGGNGVTFTVAGRNPASSGFLIGVDLLRLRRLPDDGRLALTPADGAAVRGTVPVVGYSTAPDDTTSLSIDGEEVEDRPVIGGESASLVFRNDGGNGLQRGFQNAVRVRGQEIRVADQVIGTETAWTDIPGELLGPGTNVVTFLAGTTGPGECNHDDFNLADVRLELPDGTVVTDPEFSDDSIPMGDGVCGSNQSRYVAFDFTFEIPEPAPGGVDYDPGSGFVWDTTAVADGEHTVTLAADGPLAPESRTHTVLVDNTAPVITSTAPEEGDRLKGDFTVDATVGDGAGSGVATTTATLDGEPVALGSTLSSDDLADGPHTLVFTVTDRAGNTTTTEVAVTSVAERPDRPQLVAPADGATGVSTDPRLQVTASDPAGDPLSVTFLRATGTTPQQGESAAGMAPTQPPPVIDPDGAAPLTGPAVTAASASDGAYAATPRGDGFPYQRFDFRLRAGDAARSSVGLTWEGRIDPAREVVLFAWDVAASAWVELARGRGVAGRDIELRSQVDLARYRDGDVVHVLVQGSDPFADDIADPPDRAFRDPDTYDFSLAWMTDTQYLSEGAVATRPDSYQFGEAYRDINEWIVANADERKIAYTAHTGDIINNWITIGEESAGYEERARREFAFASDTMAILEDAGMPYGVTPGNHDNKFGTTNELYNEYFPPSRFEEASSRATQDYYGGSWREGDNQNHYDLFSAGGQDFLVVYLGFIAGQEEIDWANEVLAAHADRKAIFATHEYLRPSNAPDGRNGALSDENTRSQGAEFFNEVVLPNENVFLTLSGHTHGVALNIRRDVDGVQGRTVVEMLANYQFFEVGGDRRTGHFRLLQFDVDRSEVSVNTYSPVLDDHNADEFDTANNRDYTPSADEFTVPVDLESRTTAFETDAIRLEERLTEAIGTQDVASGSEAATTWDGLQPGVQYLWYARAADAFGGVAESEVFTFTTATPAGGPGDPDGPGDPGGPGGPGTSPDDDDGGPGDDGGSPDGSDPDDEGPTSPGDGDGDGDGGDDDGGPDDRDEDDDGDAGDGGDDGGGPGDGGGLPDDEDDTVRVQRFAAAGRTQTALEISRSTFADGAAGGVVLSRPDLYPDALAGAPLAVQQNAPLLLTASEGLEPAVAAEIQRVLPDGGQVHLLGGVHAISAAVEADVAALGYEPVRLGGANRFETAVIVAAQGVGDPAQVLVADGANFPDALSAGAAAGANGAAVVLTGGDSLPPETAAYLEGRDGPVVAIGGPAARAVPSATPVVGAERIATSVAVAERFFDGPQVVGIATAAAFPDALAGGAAAGRAGGPVLLSYPDELPAPVASYLGAAAGLRSAMLFGGTEALDATVEDAVETIVAPG